MLDNFSLVLFLLVAPIVAYYWYGGAKRWLRTRRFMRIDRVLSGAYRAGLISSYVMHELDAAFKYGHTPKAVCSESIHDEYCGCHESKEDAP